MLKYKKKTESIQEFYFILILFTIKNLRNTLMGNAVNQELTIFAVRTEFAEYLS